jgi:hypothetical protein
MRYACCSHVTHALLLLLLVWPMRIPFTMMRLLLLR